MRAVTESAMIVVFTFRSSLLGSSPRSLASDCTADPKGRKSLFGIMFFTPLPTTPESIVLLSRTAAY